MSHLVFDPCLRFGTSVGYPTEKVLSNLSLIPHFQAMSFYLCENGFSPSYLSDEFLKHIKETLEHNHVSGFIHACLRYNLVGSSKLNLDPKFKNKLTYVTKSLPEEMDYACYLGFGLIVHCGVCEYEEKGYQNASKNLQTCLTKESTQTQRLAKLMGVSKKEFIARRRIILENSAHERNDLGNTLDDIKKLIYGIDKKHHKQIGLCIDTCHAFSSGLCDFRKKESVVSLFEGIDKELPECIKVELIHLNDSKNGYLAGIDRHETLGKGKIFSESTEGLKELLHQCKKRRIPFVSETPDPVSDWLFCVEHFPMYQEEKENGSSE